MNHLQATTEFFARIERERAGTPISVAEDLRKSLRVQVPEFTKALGIKVATYKKRTADKETLTGSRRRGSCSDDRKDFDVAKWFAEWITQPQPSLGGMKPTQLLDTPTGRLAVARLVGAMGSGVYL